MKWGSVICNLLKPNILLGIGAVGRYRQGQEKFKIGFVVPRHTVLRKQEVLYKLCPCVDQLIGTYLVNKFQKMMSHCSNG
ncbi:hypothetical protein CMV_003793 [Castanea mollissima]|uniref:Uncharacterized protein n=1 Tax=Castanea mollissima TaxID=60419 RepID=A0A8J4RST6_9ROSI|nr:hypothetical protein CMV_003793 [Castanea mollissima]